MGLLAKELRAARATLLKESGSLPEMILKFPSTLRQRMSSLYRSTLPSKKFLENATPSARMAERVGFLAPYAAAGYLYANRTDPYTQEYVRAASLPVEATGTALSARSALRKGDIPLGML